ncbi:MAG: polyribonucleotide nucleotidyltransferase [Proteobacteria bacterium]|nr:polyribonucleotide nucleotidyltransferase [Pseudomonadota bacterium]
MNELNLNADVIEFQYGDRNYKLEANKVARQTTASVMVTTGDTVVLATVVAKKESDPAKDFFPLAVFYQEKFYAAGKIPGGYFKREARPTEQETLTSRLIDRPIRPLFPSSFTNEVQIITTVMSLEKGCDADIPAMIGASAALALSGIPFQGPIAAAKVGFINNSFVLNPNREQLANSMLDMVVAGTKDAVLMVESEAHELDEDLMLGAVLFGHQEQQVVIDAINTFKANCGAEPWEVEDVPSISTYQEHIVNNYSEAIKTAFTIRDKADRGNAIGDIKEKILADFEEVDDLEKGRVLTAFKNTEKNIVRENILSNQPRIDGRDLDTVRPLAIETSLLPRAHGSALFTRGETQAIVAATLGSVKDMQRLESLHGEEQDPFMLHYNFPGYSVGEISMPMGPKRREIGHGNLAKRAIRPVLPNSDEFGYTLRVVSEITESNGSSSMATVCGTSLSLMDAGVPLKSPVAGVAMGLIKEGDKFATALQMDIKIEGINEEIMETALVKAKAARMHILERMNQVISSPKELSESAPSMTKMTVAQDKIKEIIGKGGAVIKAIQAETEASVDINDDGEVTVFAENKSSMQAALDRIEKIIEEPELNKVYEGTVVKIVEFGAFVNILPGKDGLLHISEISQERVEDVNSVLSEGDVISVKLIGFDRGKLKLSKKALDQN